MSFPKRVLAVLNYNEKKVSRGVAAFIGARGYLQEAGALNVYQKLEGLQRRNELNSRAVTKTLHVSLNFHPSERLTEAVLLQIAAAYMERIGFGDQPYLVYRHDDSGHPHLHIVSTTIRADGSRIRTHNLGRQASEQARRAVEELFGLVRAEGQKQASGTEAVPPDPLVAEYGRAETKRTIARVVSKVLDGYAFTSLAGYNAALRPFGVLADPGKEGSRIYGHGGLVYRLLDEKGTKVGVPLKASVLPGGPTLDKVRLRFARGALKKERHKGALKERIDRCLEGKPICLEQLVEVLNKQGISTLLHRSGEGRLYGITYVDHQTRCVFKGSDLGKGYSARGLETRLATGAAQRAPVAERLEGGRGAPGAVVNPAPLPQGRGSFLEARLVNLVLSPEAAPESLPAPLLPKKRRKKKRGSGNQTITL